VGVKTRVRQTLSWYFVIPDAVGGKRDQAIIMSRKDNLTQAITLTSERKLISFGNELNDIYNSK
jgi:hypothetical protein